jgi:NAD(P)-dependent dehydrogenase (short-subunit alcohol dehydrogenase family)
MLPRGKGNIFFTGATASLRGGVGYVAFARAKFGLRSVAQATAREAGLGVLFCDQPARQWRSCII